MTKQKTRQSNLEMLRIVSMILIVMSHCDEIFGLSVLYSTSLGVNKLINDWLHIGGQVGVGCFVLISGYFMIDQTITVKKILKLAGEVWFYTISIWIIWMGYHLYQGSIIIQDCLWQTVWAFFPILFSHYWFVTAYVILLLLSPFLNKFIYTLDKHQYKCFLAILIFIFVVLIGGVPIEYPAVLQDMATGKLMPVFVMYFIAGYIRRFGFTKKNNSIKHFIIAIVCYAILFASFYCFTYLGIMFNRQGILDIRYFYRKLNSPLVVVICIELFIGFLELDIKYNKLINEIAGCTFGVYLIHSNRLVEQWLSKVFPIYLETRPIFIFIYSLAAVLLIYIVCTLIDWIRKNSIERVWILFLNRHLESIQVKIKRSIERWGIS